MHGKTFELIYSTQRTGFEPGRAYSNPRFFTHVRQEATKVIVVGDWPKVAQAYREAGVEVVECDFHDLAEVIGGKTPEPRKPPTPVAHSLTSDLTPDERAQMEIPEDWRELHWQTLRSLATKLSDEVVINKDGAVAVIEAELARRAAAAEALAGGSDVEGAGGLVE